MQDAERKAIAHELHDEIGPHLFALRARAAMLASRLKKDDLGDYAMPPADQPLVAMLWGIILH